MTLRQAKWAEQHDWFRNMHPIGFGIWKVVVRDDASTMGIRYFESYDELRAWAGY